MDSLTFVVVVFIGLFQLVGMGLLTFCINELHIDIQHIKKHLKED